MQGSPFRETEGRVDIALAIPLREGRLLVARRTVGRLAGYWEFPGGKIEAGEDPLDAARRELAEETGLRAATLEPLMIHVHDYTEAPLRFHVFLAREPLGEVCIDGGREFAWKRLGELQEIRMPPANAPVLRALRWRVAASAG